MRRMASKLAKNEISLSDAANVWESSKAPLINWCEFLIRNVPVTPLRSSKGGEVFLFTDASKHGWGAVLISSGLVLHTGSQWEHGVDVEDINALEAKAVAHAASHFADHLEDRIVRLVVDNTSVMFSLRKGSARTGRLNAAIGSAMAKLGFAKPRMISVAWIESKKMPADEPSRGKALSWAKLGDDLREWMADLASTNVRELPLNACRGEVSTRVGVDVGA